MIYIAVLRKTMALDNNVGDGGESMKIMAQMNIPCIMVDNDNFSRWWPSITKCMQQCDFIAIDLVCCSSVVYLFVCLIILFSIQNRNYPVLVRKRYLHRKYY